MKNFITSALVLLFVAMGINAFGQANRSNVTVNKQWHLGGYSLSIDDMAVDSIGAYWTEILDFSLFDGQTATSLDSVSYFYNFVTPGGTADSVRVEMWGSFDGWYGSERYQIIDTLNIVGATTDGTAAANLVFYKRMPLVQIKIYPWTSGAGTVNRDGTLHFGIYDPNVDYMPPFQSWGKHY